MAPGFNQQYKASKGLFQLFFRNSVRDRKRKFYDIDWQQLDSKPAQEQF
jgi:hypothetical protein